MLNAASMPPARKKIIENATSANVHAVRQSRAGKQS